jgi:hypothetical protein
LIHDRRRAGPLAAKNQHERRLPLHLWPGAEMRKAHDMTVMGSLRYTLRDSLVIAIT